MNTVRSAPIDRDVPPPASAFMRRFPTVAALLPGESVFFPVSWVGGNVPAFQRTVTIYARRAGRRLITRSRVEGGVRGVRVWRVALNRRGSIRSLLN